MNARRRWGEDWTKSGKGGRTWLGRRSDDDDFLGYTSLFLGCFWVVSVLSFNQDRNKELLLDIRHPSCAARHLRDTHALVLRLDPLQQSTDSNLGSNIVPARVCISPVLLGTWTLLVLYIHHVVLI